MPLISCPSFEFEDEIEEPEVVSLKDDGPSKPKGPPSLDSLDRSLHELEEERSRYGDEATPDLFDLPSDDGDAGFSTAWDVKSQSSVLSFDEIPLEDTEYNEAR